MNLPNYFLADLPPEASLTPTMITEACQTLKRNRVRYLADRPTEQLINILVRVAENWRDPEYPIRQHTLESGPRETGFSEPTLRSGLDTFFNQLTAKNIESLLVQELGHADRLDRFSGNEDSNGTAFAQGPELLVHITGGVLPNPTFTSIILGLLARSAQFVKCATGTAFLPRMFAHSIYDAEPKLGACLEIAEWKGGAKDLEEALFAEAKCLTATGSDETLGRIRAKIPQNIRFLGYGHQISFAFIASEMLGRAGLTRLVKACAQDVIAWNQLGCLSPHVIYVEAGGNVPPDQFADSLAAELAIQEQIHPRGKLSDEDAGAIAYRRSFYEIRAAGSSETRLWQSIDSTAWTVVYENDPRFQMSCLNRFIYVKAVANLEEVLRGADAVFGKVSTVGLAASSRRTTELTAPLARWGVTRICPVGQMQHPPLSWRHDGRPPLGDLLTWTDLEM